MTPSLELITFSGHALSLYHDMYCSAMNTTRFPERTRSYDISLRK